MMEVHSNSIVLEGYMVVADSDLPHVLEALPKHIRLTKEEPGCLVFSVLQRPSEPNVFDVFEAFTNRETFDAHQKRVKQSAWSKVAANVERHYKVKGVG
ncbi:MAG: antibiotic biosynthesis monooxygenase [Cyanobacteria bacterium J06649_4]